VPGSLLESRSAARASGRRDQASVHPIYQVSRRSACRYGDAVDVKRATDLYAQGRTLRQIGAELGVHWSTVGQQLQRAGVTMRRGGPSAHPASTQQILELRAQGLTWPEIAEQVDMTVSGAWSRYRRARPSQSPRLGR
jgi:Sigma-70, region 4